MTLLEFYLSIGCKFSLLTPIKIVESEDKGNLTLLKCLFDNNLIDSTQYQNILYEAILANHVHILEYLTKKHNIKFGKDLPTSYNSINIYDYHDMNLKILNSKINDATLCWLWSNEYKWTESQAKKFNNQFMLKMIESDK
jgi:hypothetical protein